MNAANYVKRVPPQTALSRALNFQAGTDLIPRTYPQILYQLLQENPRCPEWLVRNVGVNAKDEFGFPLIVLATRLQSIRAFSILIREGADVNAVDLQGNTALHNIDTRVKDVYF